jgi:hypothetical protein
MNRLIPISGGGTFSILTLLANASPGKTGGNLQEDTVNFVVDTSEAPTLLILPEGIGLQNINIKFYVSDLSGQGATNPITIQTASEADTINGASSIAVNTAHGNAWITGTGSLNLGNTFAWIATFGGLASSFQQGGGGGGIQLLEFDVTFTQAEIIAMFENPDAGALEILGIPPSGAAYDIVTFNAIKTGGTPIVTSAGNPVIQASTSVGAFPMFQSATGWANGSDSAGLPPCLFNPGPGTGILRELNIGGTFVLCSDAAYTIISGGFSLRVYGLYRVKLGAL